MPDPVASMAPAGVIAPITPPTAAAVLAVVAMLVVAAAGKPAGPLGMGGASATGLGASQAFAPRASNSAMVCISERQI